MFPTLLGPASPDPALTLADTDKANIPPARARPERGDGDGADHRSLLGPVLPSPLPSQQPAADLGAVVSMETLLSSSPLSLRASFLLHLHAVSCTFAPFLTPRGVQLCTRHLPSGLEFSRGICENPRNTRTAPDGMSRQAPCVVAREGFSPPSSGSFQWEGRRHTTDLPIRCLILEYSYSNPTLHDPLTLGSQRRTWATDRAPGVRDGLAATRRLRMEGKWPGLPVPQLPGLQKGIVATLPGCAEDRWGDTGRGGQHAAGGR